MSATVFLGGGRITGALISGLRLAEYRPTIIVHDRHASKMRALQKRFGIIPEPDLEHAVRCAKLLIIAVRPDGVKEILREIGNVRKPVIAVSLAAGIPLPNVRGELGPAVRWVRAMPSPVCRSGRGLTALAFDRKVQPKDRRAVEHFFGLVGKVIILPEAKFDAFTVTYSSSQGYHALKSLSDAGLKLGLDRRTALTAAAHALSDGVGAWRDGNLSLDHLLHEAATPGGIAATVMAAMDAAGFEHAIEQGLRAGLQRARQNAKR